MMAGTKPRSVDLENGPKSESLKLENASPNESFDIAAPQEALDDDPVYGYEQQRKIIHRLDWRLITTAGIIYMNSLMDRSNLPNAAIAGMNEDLDMETGFRYVSSATKALAESN
jgi:hypothetical protein